MLFIHVYKYNILYSNNIIKLTHKFSLVGSYLSWPQNNGQKGLTRLTLRVHFIIHYTESNALFINTRQYSYCYYYNKTL